MHALCRFHVFHARIEILIKSTLDCFLQMLLTSLLEYILMHRPHVSGDFCIRKFFYADTKISASTRSIYESYTTVHTYQIRIWTSQRISQQSMRKKTGSDIVTSAYTEISGYSERIRRTRVDARCIRIKKFADTRISGYVWTGPKTIIAIFCHYSPRFQRIIVNYCFSSLHLCIVLF